MGKEEAGSGLSAGLSLPGGQVHRGLAVDSGEDLKIEEETDDPSGPEQEASRMRAGKVGFVGGACC